MMVSTFSRPRSGSGLGPKHGLFGVLIVASMMVQAWLAFVLEFNWDEFYFLGLVHDYLRGELSTVLQTIHVHLFAPLAMLPGTEVSQLITGRLVMLLFEAATLFALYSLCRIWTDRGPSLFAVAAYALLPVTMQHGASFRTDPLALALSMTALACLARARPNWRTAAAIGILAALAALVTVKVIFFAPAFAAIAWWRYSRDEQQSSIAGWFVMAGAVALAAFLLCYALHQASLSQASLAGSSAMMGSAARKTLIESSLFPRDEVLIDSLLRAPVQSLMLLYAVALLIVRAIKGSQRSAVIAILGCVAPMACLAVYRNAFPYFMPFILAPAFIAIAWLIQSRSWSANFHVVLGLIMAATAVPSLVIMASHGQEKQRLVMAVVHQIFPQPVIMIDRSQMIASFPKRGFFMSTWGGEAYRAKGQPIFADILEREPVPLLLLDSPSLAEAVGVELPRPVKWLLLAEDRKTLQDNYVEHWGPIWVAGRTLTVSPQDSWFDLRVPGAYTVEGSSIVLDGRELAPGVVVELARGRHRISSRSAGTVTLRWGRHLLRPSGKPPEQPMYFGF